VNLGIFLVFEIFEIERVVGELTFGFNELLDELFVLCLGLCELRLEEGDHLI
jgi:hypothetical protein